MATDIYLCVSLKVIVSNAIFKIYNYPEFLARQSHYLNTFCPVSGIVSVTIAFNDLTSESNQVKYS